MFLFSSRRRHTRCALVTGVQTCALPICMAMADPALMQAGSDWPAYGGTYSARRYSPLAQITPANVGKLERAWLIHTGDMPSKAAPGTRSEEHTSELQSLMRISYAVFCLKKKNNQLVSSRTISKNKTKKNY